MSVRSFVFGVDLDGVVADFYGGLRPIAAEWLGVALDTLPTRISWGLAEWGVEQAAGGYDKLHRFAVTQRELFLKVPPMPGAPQALRRLSIEGVRIRIITHRLFIKYFHQVAVNQTIQWLDRHDIPYWDLCFMQQKTAVGADLYIEDSPMNVERLRAEGAKTIVFTNSTNEHLPGPRASTWDEVAKMVLAEKAEWESRNASLP
jgi:5'(3')-deoxyribonucleotidase